MRREFCSPFTLHVMSLDVAACSKSEPDKAHSCLPTFELNALPRSLTPSFGLSKSFLAAIQRAIIEKQWSGLHSHMDNDISGSYAQEKSIEERTLVETFERCREDDIVRQWGRQRVEESLDYLLNFLEDRTRETTASDRNLRRRALRSLLRFTREMSLFPPSLFISGVRMGTFASFGGGFADVHQGEWKGLAVAVKRLRVFDDDPEEKRERIRKALFREALIWRTLKHRNILPLLGVDMTTGSAPFLMISPWMANGNIVQYVTASFDPTMSADAMLREVAAGLEYLHSQGLVHGDIRGTNVLVDQDLRPRISDFGLAHLCDMTQTSNGGGSVRWMAPELHDPRAFGLEHSVRSRQSDVFAFGMLCIEVATGQPPFSDLRTDGAAFLAIIRGERPNRPEGERSMSEMLWGWASSCWTHQPSARPSINELMEDTCCAGTSTSLATSPRGKPARRHVQPSNVSTSSRHPLIRPASSHRIPETVSGRVQERIKRFGLLTVSGEVGSLHGLVQGPSRKQTFQDGTQADGPPAQPDDVFAKHAYANLEWDMDLDGTSDQLQSYNSHPADSDQLGYRIVRVPSKRS